MPDLRCTIEVYGDAAGTKPIAYKQQLAYSGSAPNVHVRMTFENVGGMDAERSR